MEQASAVTHDANCRVNPDLQKERDTASFNPVDLTYIIDNGKENTLRRREVVKKIFSNPIFSSKEKYSMNLQDRYNRAIRQVTTLMGMAMEEGWFDASFVAHIGGMLRYDLAMLLHFVMFMPTLERLCTEEQKAYWLPRAMTADVIGTYAQTELGHGTYLRGLETTATYDRVTQKFILNTPFPTGMKWWPGALGKTCNHAIVMAMLKLDGQDCGMQAFIVPIRNMETHKPLSGIEVGDIGPRMGLVTADNGFLILRNVHIPRKNMLMKYSKVTPDGHFVKQGSDKANYGTMMMVRSRIVSSSAMYMSQACTIAARYSAVRHQSELKPGAPEPQIIDYQTQQYKIFPNIALAYASFFAERYMNEYYNYCYRNEIQKGNFQSVGELHSQSSALKAYVSDLVSEGIEILRRACGGHGYLMASGLCDLSADATGGITYEGENTVLYLQTARYLMKCFASGVSGEKLGGSSAYLMKEPPSFPAFSEKTEVDSRHLPQVFARRAYFMVGQTARKLQATIESGVPHYQAWNEHSVDLVRAAKAHTDSFVALNFLDMLSKLDTKPEVVKALGLLCQLHALHRIVVCSGEFLESEALTVNQLDWIRSQELKLLPLVRPEAIALVDAFEWHDESLSSALGRYDGNVYETLYEMAKRGPMNETEVHSSYFDYIKPFQQKSKI